MFCHGYDEKKRSTRTTEMVLIQRVQHIHKDLEFSKDDVKYSVVYEFLVKYLQRNLTFEIYIVCKLTIYCKLIFKAFKVTTLEGCKACAGKHATLVFELSRQRFLQTNAQKNYFAQLSGPRLIWRSRP